MAHYLNLPIFKAAYDVALHFEKVVAGFSRYHKYTLGTELRNLSREVLKLVVQANSAKNRRDYLLQLRETLEVLKVVMRLCKDVKAFKNFKAFEYASTTVVGIARQNEGWLKSCRA